MLNGVDIKEVGGDVKRERIRENEVVAREVVSALKMMEGDRESDMDVKNGGIRIIDWLRRVFNKCMESGVVPEDWKAACIVPVYKGKGDGMGCASRSGKSVFSILGKIYGRVLISRVIERKKEQVVEEQRGFRSR